MKKAFAIFAFVCFLPLLVSGQSFQKGSQVIAVGVGIGSSIGSGVDYTSQIPAISAQYERGIWDIGGPGVISLGAYVGYKSFGQEISSGGVESEAKWNYTLLGIRSAYHYNGIDNDKLDVYGGLMLGFYLLDYSYSDNTGFNDASGGNYGSTAGLTIYVGGRYYFSDQVGGFAELGYGVSYLNLGIAFKL